MQKPLQSTSLNIGLLPLFLKPFSEDGKIVSVMVKKVSKLDGKKVSERSKFQGLWDHFVREPLPKKMQIAIFATNCSVNRFLIFS